MDALIRQQAVLLFTEYNRVLGEVYEDLLSDVTSESTLASEEFQEYLENSVINSLQPWFVTELDGLTAETPEGFFDSLINLDDVMDVFEVAAEMLDGDLPDLLMLRVGAFGEESCDRLVKMAMHHDWTPAPGEDDDTFRTKIAVDLAALRVLGKWTYTPSVEPVLSRFSEISEPDEYLADGLKTYAVSLGAQIVPALIARIDGAAATGLKGPYEYLVISLTTIGSQEPSEEIFQCLKTAFRNMDHKVIASICLGDYGDGRAVPLLKSYLDRNVNTIDRQFFYETLSAIKRLGGDISDIQDPFRDFSGKQK